MKMSFGIAPVAALAAALLAGPAWATQSPATVRAQDGLEEQVRRELVVLPFYGVFDNLNYEVQGDTVTLSGQVTRPTLKRDAEAVVKRIEGVSNIVNQIEVLPLSPMDNRIRRAVYWTLFSGNSALFRYGLGADPSIHILVENGHVTLVGTVGSEAEKTMATLYVRQLPGIFSVTNHLTVG